MRRVGILGLVVAGAALAAPVAVRQLATVDGQSIAPETLRRAAAELGSRGDMMLANPTLRRQLLDHLIETRILAAAAERDGLASDHELQEALAEARTQLLASLYAKRYVAAHTGEAALKAFFAKDPLRFSAKEVHAYHILVKDKAAAAAVLAAARQPGADFQALAKRRSQSPSAAHGGDLGFFPRGRMLPEIDKAAFGLAKGQVYGSLVQTAFGYHIIKVADIKGDDDVRFEDVRDRVKEAAARAAREELVAKLRGKARIAVDEEAVRAMPAAATL